MRLRVLLVGCVASSCFSESPGTGSAGSDPTTGTDGTDASEATTASSSATVGESSSSASTTEPSTSNATTGPDMTTAPDTGEVESDTEDCPADSVPVPPPPGPEWSGPFMLVPDDTECPQPLEVMMPSPIFAMPAIVTECACTCEGRCGLAVASDDDPECSTVLHSSLADEECHAVILNAYAQTTGSSGNDDSCETPTAVTPPPVGFGETHRVCAGADASCLPTTDASIGPCFRVPGHEVSCAPTGLPREIRVMLGAEVDCQSCESCMNELDAACHAATVTAHPTSDCEGAGSPIVDGVCTQVDGTGVRIDFDLECPRARAQVVPAGPATYCCAGPG